jgi:hypothetical protein
LPQSGSPRGRPARRSGPTGAGLGGRADPQSYIILELVAEEAAVAELEAAADASADAVGLAEPDPAAGLAEPGAADAASLAEPGVPEEAPMSPAARWGLEGPDPDGYFKRGDRRMLRILRGNPRNSISVRCLLHTGCSFLVPLRLGLTDSQIIEWCFALGEPDALATRGEIAEVVARHKALAKRLR